MDSLIATYTAVRSPDRTFNNFSHKEGGGVMPITVLALILTLLFPSVAWAGDDASIGAVVVGGLIDSLGDTLALIFNPMESWFWSVVTFLWTCPWLFVWRPTRHLASFVGYATWAFIGLYFTIRFAINAYARASLLQVIAVSVILLLMYGGITLMINALLTKQQEKVNEKIAYAKEGFSNSKYNLFSSFIGVLGVHMLINNAWIQANSAVDMTPSWVALGLGVIFAFMKTRNGAYWWRMHAYLLGQEYVEMRKTRVNSADDQRAEAWALGYRVPPSQEMQQAMANNGDDGGQGQQPPTPAQPTPTPQQPTPQPAPAPQGPITTAPPVVRPVANWLCPCGQSNHPSFAFCQRDGRPRPAGHGQAAQPPGGIGGPTTPAPASPQPATGPSRGVRVPNRRHDPNRGDW